MSSRRKRFPTFQRQSAKKQAQVCNQLQSPCTQDQEDKDGKDRIVDQKSSEHALRVAEMSRTEN